MTRGAAALKPDLAARNPQAVLQMRFDKNLADTRVRRQPLY